MLGRLGRLGLIVTLLLAWWMPVSHAGQQLIDDLVGQLRLPVKEQIFEGEIFGQAVQAWLVEGESGFPDLLNELSKKRIFADYMSLGHLIQFSGDYQGYSLLLQVERVAAEGYRGFISMMPSYEGRYGVGEEEELHQLLSEKAVVHQSHVDWLPATATLLLDTKSLGTRQQIYSLLMPLEQLRSEVSQTLVAQGWRQMHDEGFGLARWQRDGRQLRLYFKEDGALSIVYLLDHALTKD